MDLTKSLNRSYNDLIGNDGTNEFLAGGNFAGFRYATEQEVITLWTHAGITTDSAGAVAANSNSVTIEVFAALVGFTGFNRSFSDGTFRDVIQGITGSPGSAGSGFRSTGNLSVIRNGVVGQISTGGFANISNGVGATVIGNYLVR